MCGIPEEDPDKQRSLMELGGIRPAYASMPNEIARGIEERVKELDKLANDRAREAKELSRVAKSIVFAHLYEARFEGLVLANVHRLPVSSRTLLQKEVDTVVKEILTQFILNDDFPSSRK